MALIALGAWLVHFTWLQRQVHYKKYNFTMEEVERLSNFPQAQYDFGRRAWMALDAAAAAEHYRRAVSGDVLHIDAWLRLAEAEASMGNIDRARTILTHTDSRVANVYRWKWTQMLLARELGIDDIFMRNINFLIAHDKKVQDALQLLDGHVEGSAPVAVEALHPDNLASYLEWLMRWQRVEDTDAVWRKMAVAGPPDPDVALQYVHFLVGYKQIRKAGLIWQTHSGSNGMTNAGFEAEVTRLGFDWRFGKDKK